MDTSAADLPQWLATRRAASRERLARIGMPTRKLEAWRYTDLSPLRGVEAPWATPSPTASPDPRLLAPWRLREVSASVVFVDGHRAEELCTPASALPRGLRVQSLASVLREEPDPVRDTLGHADSALDDEPYAELNTATFADGVLVRVDRGAQIAAPVELLFVTTERSHPTSTVARVLVDAGDGSAVTVVERYVGLGRQPYLTNAVTELALGRDARVEHVKMQQEGPAAVHFATLLARPGHGAELRSHVVTLGAASARNAVHVAFEAERAQCTLTGLYAAAHGQSHDHYTVIDHRAPHCTSAEVYKGVVGEKAVGSFLGRVLIREGAVRSATEQLARTLLLSDSARANCKPQLEIDNDDVTASHGAAIGQLDSDALFYLESRGIPPVEARGLLIRGFLQELVDRLPVAELAEGLPDLVLGRVGGASAAEGER